MRFRWFDSRLWVLSVACLFPAMAVAQGSPQINLPELAIPGHTFSSSLSRVLDEASLGRTLMAAERSLFLRSGAELTTRALSDPLEGVQPGIGGFEVISAGPSRSGQYYVESVRDLDVKVIGGRVSVRRKWDGERWVFHPALRSLELVQVSGQVAGIVRQDVQFERESPTAAFFRSARGLRIEQTPSGYEHVDRDGFRSSYDLAGAAVAFGERGSPDITITRTTGGEIASFVDINSLAVITFEHVGGMLTAAVDHSGRRVEYQYSAGQLSRVVDPLGHEWDYTYVTDTAGVERLATKADPEGRTTTFSYRASGRLASITRPDGTTLNYAYGHDSGKREHYRRVSSPDNRIEETWLDATGSVLRIDVNGRTIQRFERAGTTDRYFDEHGNLTQYVRDAQGRLLRLVRPDGTVATIVYDPTHGIPQSVVDERGVKTTFSYNSDGTPASFTEAEGTALERTTQVVYGANGLISSIIEVVPGGADRSIIFAYDAFGNVETLTDRDGDVWTFAYNSIGQMILRRNPRLHDWTWAYDDVGNLTSYVAPEGQGASYLYDKVGNLTRRTDTGLAVSEWSYDAMDRPTLRRNSELEEWTYGYTSGGFLNRVTAPDGQTWTVDWDRDGVPVQVRDPAGVLATFVRIPGGTITNPGSGPLLRFDYGAFKRDVYLDFDQRTVRRVESGSDGATRDVAYRHDGVGNLLSLTRTDGVAAQYEYDVHGRLNRTFDFEGAQTDISIDRWMSQIVVTEPGGRVTTLLLDEGGNLLSESRGGSGTTSFEYDSAGNMIERSLPGGQRVEYDHDAANRIVALRAYPDAVAVVPSETASFGYSSRSMLTSFSNGSASTLMTRDSLGRLLTEQTTYPGFQRGHALTYGATGLVSTLTAPDGQVTSFAFDGSGRLVSMAPTGEGAVSFGPYQLDKPLRVIFPGGMVNELDWDSLGQLKKSVLKDGTGQEVARSEYTLDTNGAPVSLATELGAVAYTYDPSGRVVNASAGVLPSESWSFNLAGQRQPVAGPTWVYGAGGELITAGPVEHVYDTNGSRIQTTEGTSRRTFEYDARNRLTRVLEGSIGSEAEIASYGFDALGRRLWVESGGTRTYFYHYPEGVAAELDATGSVLRSFAYEPQSSYGTRPLLQRSASSQQYVMVDLNGRASALADTSGAVSWRTHYSTLGDAVTTTAATAFPLRLAGQMHDSSTGLMLDAYRVFDPASGQYLQPDPIGFVGSRNRYAYAEDELMTRVDILGLKGAPPLMVGKIIWPTILNCFPMFFDPCEFTPLTVGECGDALKGLPERALKAVGKKKGKEKAKDLWKKYMRPKKAIYGGASS